MLPKKLRHLAQHHDLDLAPANLACFQIAQILEEGLDSRLLHGEWDGFERVAAQIQLPQMLQPPQRVWQRLQPCIGGKNQASDHRGVSAQREQDGCRVNLAQVYACRQSSASVLSSSDDSLSEREV